MRAGSADLTAPRKLLLCFSRPRPSRARAGTLACCVPHGAAPTPNGEWARRRYTADGGFRRAASLVASPVFCLELVRLHLAVSYSSSFPLTSRRRPCGPSLAGFPSLGSAFQFPALAPASLCPGVGAGSGKRLGDGTSYESLRSTGPKTQQAILSALRC